MERSWEGAELWERLLESIGCTECEGDVVVQAYNPERSVQAVRSCHGSTGVHVSGMHVS